MVLSCISLMISDTEHFFMCLLAMCIYSLEKYQFSYSAHFLIRLLVFLMLSCMICLYILNINPLLVISSVQLLSRVQLFATPWTAACQALLSITNSQSLLKPMSTESVMPSNHLILCCPLLLLPSIFPSIRVFSNESVLIKELAKVLKFQLQHQSFQ